MMFRFHVLTTICALFVLPVFSHKARQPKEDDSGLESCKFLDNTAFYNQGKIFFPDGVLITGTEYPHMGTAELYLPSSSISCSLPKLPWKRHNHILENLGLMCGGVGTSGSCIQWNSGTWDKLKLKLDEERYDHVSWTPDNGIGTYLIGGSLGGNGRTTTLIKPDGTQEATFPLKYNTL